MPVLEGKAGAVARFGTVVRRRRRFVSEPFDSTVVGHVGPKTRNTSLTVVIKRGGQKITNRVLYLSSADLCFYVPTLPLEVGTHLPVAVCECSPPSASP